MSLSCSPARALLAAASAALAASAVLPLAGVAAADPVPFTDQYVQGGIGLCDAQGNPVTSGRLSDKPFVALAVSSQQVPPGYGVTNTGKAALYAFQPRQQVDAGEWSGQLMTGGSVFSNDTYPMTAGTTLDASMADFIEAYPPKWNGLVELRMYFGAPNKVTFRRSYPAAVLRVTGDRWSVVQGANVPCTEGKAVSTERILLPSSAFGPQRQASSGTPAATGASAAATSRGTTAAGSAKPSGSAGHSTGTAATARGTSGQNNVAAPASSQSSAGLWTIAGLALLALVGGGLAYLRRRARS